MIMVGLGGIYVEIFKDISFGFAPLSTAHIDQMINSLKTAELLAGSRGQKAYDVSALTEVITRINQLVTDFPEIEELDINPLLVLPNGQGTKVLDARITITP